jgi:hypothetical protein
MASNWTNYLTALDDALEGIVQSMALAQGAFGWTPREQQQLERQITTLRAAWLERRPDQAIADMQRLLSTHEHSVTARNNLELIASWSAELRELEDETKDSKVSTIRH